MALVILDNVCKNYKGFKAVSNVSFQIEHGECLMFYGKNGSGKSTTIKLILGLSNLKKGDSGYIYKDDINIGYVQEKVELPKVFTIKEYLTDYFSIKNSNFNFIELAKYFELDIEKKLSELSKGMKQKVALIMALDTSNDLFIFDEAINGLDDESIQKFIFKLTELKNLKKTIIIVTHYKEIYEKICERQITFESSRIIEDCNIKS